MLLYSSMQISCSSCSIKLTSVLGPYTFAVTSQPYVPESSKSILSTGLKHNKKLLKTEWSIWESWYRITDHLYTTKSHDLQFV